MLQYFSSKSGVIMDKGKCHLSYMLSSYLRVEKSAWPNIFLSLIHILLLYQTRKIDHFSSTSLSLISLFTKSPQHVSKKIITPTKHSVSLNSLFFSHPYFKDFGNRVCSSIMSLYFTIFSYE
jgi:hypothetical protein